MYSVQYFYERTAMNSLDIDNIGDCAIEATNDSGYCWYLVIDTKLGWVRVFEYGPILPDMHELLGSVKCSFDRFEWDDIKIKKRIREFLTNPKRKITQAELINRDDALSYCTDIIEYMKDKNNF